MNDLETRLTDALAARADLVRPEDLRDEPLPAPVVPLWRRTSVVLAAAACLAVVATSAALLVDDDSERPQPSEPTRTPTPTPSPSLELPPDVGRDWGLAKASEPAELDLDGDGTTETVQFRGEPSKRFDGRVRLETTLSGDGSSAYGVIDIDTTMGLFAREPVDADDDGDQELVLHHENSVGLPDFVGPILARPVVLDLRDGLLVEAPATEPDRIWQGSLVVPGAQSESYDLTHLQNFWIEDGALLSSRSVRSFPAFDMSIIRPDEYAADVVEWRLGDDGTLSPVPAEVPCRMMLPEGDRPCAEGEQDSLPPLGSFAPERIGMGETARMRDGIRFDVAIDASASEDGGADLVVNWEGGRDLRSPIGTGREPFALTTVPALAWDGASVVVAFEDSDQPDDLQVFVQDYDDLDEMVALEEVGDVSLGSGETADGRVFRSWVTANGAIYTALGADADADAGADEPWQVYTWAVLEQGQLHAVPIEQMCFDDIADPTTGRRC